MPRETTVLQGQFLQQFNVHVVPNANGEDADLTAGCLLGVIENLEGVGLPNSGFPICEEDDKGDAPVFDVIMGHVVVEEPDGCLKGPVDICACRTPTQDSSGFHTLLSDRACMHTQTYS